MLVIGICGASGSGKSTLADELCRAIGPGAMILNHDSYYRDHGHLSFQERALLNYDEPRIFDHDLVLKDVEDLLAGKAITRKSYDYSQHRRADKTYPPLTPAASTAALPAPETAAPRAPGAAWPPTGGGA